MIFSLETNIDNIQRKQAAATEASTPQGRSDEMPARSHIQLGMAVFKRRATPFAIHFSSLPATKQLRALTEHKSLRNLPGWHAGHKNNQDHRNKN
jgi:hypothetical protein